MAAGTLALAATDGPALAQDTTYPHKGNIELTVLFPAGSSADVTARILADGLSRQLAANVVVVNRPGAGGAIGYRYVAAQKPDGYSLVWSSNSISTTYHAGELPFDYRAFDAVARVLVESPLLVVRADAPWKSLQDLVADARARPGHITVGNSGAGSHTHICSVALFHAAGAQVIDVPFAGAQVVPSLLGGHVDALLQLPGALSSYLASGQMRALAALVPQRDPTLPNIPTAREQGIDASLEAWRGIAVPRGTPRPLIAILEAAIKRVVAEPSFAAASARLGVRPSFLSGSALQDLIAKEDGELGELMRLIGLDKQ
jgi:tripartite-type tricarboxylate transporter receptor subunit TctC